jgi:hypothetical protein
MKLITGILVAIVIVIICYAWTRDPSITGFWSGDVEYCQTSGIDSMLIYFDEASITGTRDAYMYIGPDIAMQQFTLHHGIFSTTAEYSDDSELWPEKLSITRRKDTIYIWDSDKTILYAKLHARADLNHITDIDE